MLVLLQRFARKFAWSRKALFIAILLSLAAVAWILIGADSATQDNWMIPALLSSIWLVLLFSAINLFEDIPERLPGPGRWLARIRISVKRGFYYAFAILTLALTAALVFNTYKLLMTW